MIGTYIVYSEGSVVIWWITRSFLAAIAPRLPSASVRDVASWRALSSDAGSFRGCFGGAISVNSIVPGSPRLASIHFQVMLILFGGCVGGGI